VNGASESGGSSALIRREDPGTPSKCSHNDQLKNAENRGEIRGEKRKAIKNVFLLQGAEAQSVTSYWGKGE